MIVMNVPAGTKRTVRWVQVKVKNGSVTCEDATVKQQVEALKPPGGYPAADPEPDWTLGAECERWLFAKIIERTANGTGEDTGVLMSSPLLLPLRAEGPDGILDDGAVEIWPGHPEYERQKAHLEWREQILGKSGRGARRTEGK
jgi:hypothetical protein